MSRRTATTPERVRRSFLDELAQGRTITAACQASGLGRRTAYDLRQRDEEFAIEWADAIEAGTDVYEDEARRRAIEGTERPVMYKGEVVETVREYSDRLLELFLKARRPEVYRERYEVTHTAAPMSPAELQRAREAGMSPEVEAAARTLAALPVVLPGGPEAGDGDRG